MTLIIKCEEKTEFEMIYHFIKEAFEQRLFLTVLNKRFSLTCFA